MKSPPMDSRSEDSTGAETDIREWALLLGSAAKPRHPHLTRQIVLDVIALVAVRVFGQGEGSPGAKASPALVGSQSTTWVEPLEIPGYEIVLVVFRADNVVAQIAILGKDSPLLSDDVKLLASTQQTRLARLLQGNA